MRTGTAHLRLAIEVDSDPIRGSVASDCEGAQPFTGWIELVAAIEEARRAPEAPVDEDAGAEAGARVGALDSWGPGVGRVGRPFKTLGFLPGANAFNQ